MLLKIHSATEIEEGKANMSKACGVISGCAHTLCVLSVPRIDNKKKG